MAAFPRIKSKLCSRSTRDYHFRSVWNRGRARSSSFIIFPFELSVEHRGTATFNENSAIHEHFPFIVGICLNFATIRLDCIPADTKSPTQSHWDSIYEHRKVLEIDDADVTTSISVSHVDNSVRNKSRGPFGVTSLIAWGTSSHCRPISIRKVVKEAWRDGSTAPHHRTKCCFNYTSTLFHPDASFRRKV